MGFRGLVPAGALAIVIAAVSLEMLPSAAQAPSS